MAKQTIVSIRDKGDNRSIILESFGKNIVIIGKSPNADIVVKNIKVSNYHGRFYKEGIYVKEDRTKAIEYFLSAFKLGSKKAEEELKNI